MSEETQQAKPATGMVVRDRGGRYAKGISGNPGGRSRVLADVRELAQQEGPRSIATLACIRDDKGVPAAARVAASVALLDRGFGKPCQSVELRATTVDRTPMDVLIESSEEARHHMLAIAQIALASLPPPAMDEKSDE